MVLTIRDLKVDQTAVPVNNDYILISNFNIPDHALDRLIEDSVPARIRRVIQEDYRGIDEIQYQLTATYQLRHAVHGGLRQWAGSFMPGGNQRNALGQFERFGEDFEDRILRLSDRAVAIQSLRFHNVDTHWEFDHLTSIIVNVQATLRETHPTLTRRNIRYQHGRRHVRSHVTFPLP
jgi:hypothetical protein